MASYAVLNVFKFYPGVPEAVKQIVAIAGDQIAVWLDSLYGAEVTDGEIFRCA